MPWKELDPSTSYTTDGWGLLGLTNDRADRVPAAREEATAPRSSRISPLRFPPRLKGGRRYAFRLRRGTRYSTREPVRASDVRFAIERALRHHARRTRTVRRHPAGRAPARRSAATCPAASSPTTQTGTVVFPAHRARQRPAGQARRAVRGRPAAERRRRGPRQTGAARPRPIRDRRVQTGPVRAPGTQPAVQIMVACRASRRLPRRHHRALRRQ